MKRVDKIFMVVLLGVLLWATSVYADKESRKTGISTPSIRFGTLSVVQALPLFVAAEKGYFSDQGIQVELIRFNSAMEKDVALTAGQISGYFGDLLTPLVLNGNGTPLKIVATIFNTTESQRMFAILSPPNSPNKTLSQMARAGIAGSSNTIVEYITTKILETQNIPLDQLNMIETKNIPIRLQILLTGQVAAAILPEPLVTLAEMKGARVVADDAGRGVSATVLAFTDRFLTESPKAVKSFLAGVSQATTFINKNPGEIRPIMNRYCQVPEPLHQKFAIPHFPLLTLPEAVQVMDVYRWLRSKGIIKMEMTYKQMVSDGFLP